MVFLRLRGAWWTGYELDREPVGSDDDRADAGSFAGKLLERDVAVGDGKPDASEKTRQLVHAELGDGLGHRFLEVRQERGARVRGHGETRSKRSKRLEPRREELVDQLVDANELLIGGRSGRRVAHVVERGGRAFTGRQRGVPR